LGRNIGLGYLWLYPRSGTEANVGVGSIDSKDVVSILTNFIKNKPELRHAKIVDKNGDTIPYSGLLPNFVDNGALLIGDAAGQVSNLVGGGVETTLVGAKMASQTITESVKLQNYSAEHLKIYEDNYRNSYAGINVQKTAKYLSKIIELSKKKDLFVYIEEILEDIEPDFINEIVGGNFPKVMFIKELLKHPLLLTLLKQFI